MRAIAVVAIVTPSLFFFNSSGSFSLKVNAFLSKKKLQLKAFLNSYNKN